MPFRQWYLVHVTARIICFQKSEHFTNTAIRGKMFKLVDKLYRHCLLNLKQKTNDSAI